MHRLKTIVLFSVLAAFHAHAQEKIFDYPTGAFIEQFESFAADSGQMAIVYVTSMPTTPRSYKTHFLCYAGGLAMERSLPVKIRPFGFGYTSTSFLFFNQAGWDDPHFDIMEMVKGTGEIKRTFRFDYGKERVLGTFTDEGLFYLLSVHKKTNEIRIRKFGKAGEPVTYSYVAPEDVLDEIDDKDISFNFVQDQYESTLDQVYPFRKMFLHNDKLYLQLRPMQTKKYQVYSGIRLVELPLDATPGELKVRNIPLDHKGRLVSFPVGDNLILFRSTSKDFNLRIVSMSSFEIIKSFSLADEGRRLMDGQLLEMDRGNFLEFDPDDVSKFPKDLEGKLKRLGPEGQFIYARQLNNKKTMLCMGKFYFPTSGGGGVMMPGGGNTVSTPYGSFTTGGTSTMHSIGSAVSGSPNFTYVYAFLNEDLSLAPYDETFALGADQLKSFANADENKRATRQFEILPLPTSTRLVGFSKRDKVFTVWSWKNP